MEMKECPFCGENKNSFEWTYYASHGRVVCNNWLGECCANGPQIHRLKTHDNPTRLRKRAIKAWNERR